MWELRVSMFIQTDSQRQDSSHEPVTATYNQSYPIISQWRRCLLSHDFPPFILNYPPLNPPHALGGLLKLNGLRGGKTDADSRCNFTRWCRCWTVFLYKNKLFIHFLMPCFVIFALFYYCTTIFFLIQFFVDAMPPLLPWRKRPYINIYIRLH